MKFSVLMSVYKEENEKYLSEALESIINQTVRPDQIVIVKDGELTEKLELVIDNYSKKYNKLIKIYGYKENKGLGYALQNGILQCDYEYVARMDSDDISRKDRFEKQIRYIEQNPNIDILGGYLQEKDAKMSRKVSVKKVPVTKKEIYKNIGKECPFNHSTVILKKSAVITAQNYKTELIEDYGLWIRMYLNNCYMENLPEILVDYRTSKKMYKRRTGIKYLKGIKKIEDIMLEHKIITRFQYIINMLERTILAIIPSKVKTYIYPKIVRKKSNMLYKKFN